MRIVALLTDGYLGNEDQILASVGTQLGDSRVFCFGVGSAVNRYLLEEMAAIGRGTAQFVRPDEDTATVVSTFQHRIDAPVLTDLRVDWNGLAVTDVVPRALPDLFLGQPLAITGHYTHGGAATIAVHGKQDGRDVRFDVRVELPERDPARPAIATVWARQRIAELSRRLVRKADSALEHEILSLALVHHLLTRSTAFVAVDDTRLTKPGADRRVVVPVEVPDAVRGISSAANGGSFGYGMSGYGVGGGGVSYGSIGIGSYGTIGHGSGLTARIAAVPTVTIGQPVAVAGSLDTPMIRRYIHRYLDKIRYCYEKRLLAKPELAGQISTQFVIDATGHVSAGSASGFDAEVASCVAGVVKNIEFPAAPGGGRVQVSYPFTFKSNVVTEEYTP